MIQNLILRILFSEILLRTYNIFMYVPVDIIRVFFISDFLAESLKANKNRPSWKLGNLRIVEKNFPAFSLPTFWFWPNTQNRKLGRKKLGKQILTFPTFPTFSVFDLPLFDLNFSSDRLSFITFCGFFCFLFLLCLNLLF